MNPLKSSAKYKISIVSKENMLTQHLMSSGGNPDFLSICSNFYNLFATLVCEDPNINYKWWMNHVNFNNQIFSSNQMDSAFLQTSKVSHSLFFSPSSIIKGSNVYFSTVITFGVNLSWCTLSLSFSTASLNLLPKWFFLSGVTPTTRQTWYSRSRRETT